ncbi:MAG: hypothetical protein ACYTFG_01695 [Planctomycetota bacterium]|jgi:hypothetical protein
MYRHRERGALLIITVTIVFIIAGMVGAMLTISVGAASRERSVSTRFSSREIAEAAIDVSLNNIRQATDGVDNDGDGTTDEGLDAHEPETPFGHYNLAEIAAIEGQLGRVGTGGWTLAADANGNGYPDIGETGVNPMAFSRGQVIAYTIFSELDGIDNDSDGTTDEVDEAGSLTVVAQGLYNGVTSTAMFSGILTETLPPPDPEMWVPVAAAAAEGNLLVTGSATVDGSQGNVHANTDCGVMNAAATISGNASAHMGLFVHENNALPAERQLPGVDRADIPDVRPETLKDQATHDFAMDGKVYDPVTGAQIWDTATQGSYQGWVIATDLVTGRPTWTFGGGGASYQGTGYFQGDVRLAGVGGGGNGAPLPLTVIAEGSIQVAGNGNYAPHNANQIYLLAAGDIKINGNPNQNHAGMIIAREQIVVAGNPTLEGVLMAADLDDAETLVSPPVDGGSLVIQGSMHLTYNGGLNPLIPVYVPVNQYILDPTFSAYEER